MVRLLLLQFLYLREIVADVSNAAGRRIILGRRIPFAFRADRCFRFADFHIHPVAPQIGPSVFQPQDAGRDVWRNMLHVFHTVDNPALASGVLDYHAGITAGPSIESVWGLGISQDFALFHAILELRVRTHPTLQGSDRNPEEIREILISRPQSAQLHSRATTGLFMLAASFLHRPRPAS